MSTVIDTERARQILNNGMEQAETVLKDPDQIAGVLDQVADKLKQVPLIGTVVSDAPIMVSMVKGYITKEYPNVSGKVIAAIVSAFLYLIKKKDLIRDDIPVLGMLDDIAVLAVALSVIKPELNAYQEWRNNRQEENVQ